MLTMNAQRMAIKEAPAARTPHTISPIFWGESGGGGGGGVMGERGKSESPGIDLPTIE